MHRRTRPFWRLDWRAEKNWSRREGGFVKLVVEVLNTTLNEEVVSLDCSTGSSVSPCREDSLGPIVIPNIGVEASF
jgi:hypothetical protein